MSGDKPTARAVTGEDYPPCIRGCARKIKDPETGEITGTVPTLASVGHLCTKDAHDLREWLRELPDLVAALDTRMTKGDPYSPNRRGKISGSPALIRLDAASMLDPRSTATRRLEAGEARPDPDDIKFGGDVSGVMILWADCLSEDLYRDDRPITLVAAVEYLAEEAWSALVYRPWVDELHTEVHEIRGILRQLNDTRDPEPLGRCSCGQMLYEPVPIPGEMTKPLLECPRCGHRINGLSLIRLKAAQDVIEASA